MSPSAPRTDRQPACALKVALLVLATAATVLLLDHLGHAERVDQASDLDVLIHSWVVRHRPDWPRLTWLLNLATRFGNPDVATAATAVVAFGLYGLWRQGVPGIRRTEAIVWLGAILGGRGLSLALKWLYQRERPPVPHRLVFVDSFSYPSGHSVFAAVFFAMLAAVITRSVPAERRLARLVGVAGCLCLAVIVGASRIWLGVHYPTDVLGGLLVGFAWVFMVVIVRRAVDRRLRAVTPTPGAPPP